MPFQGIAWRAPVFKNEIRVGVLYALVILCSILGIGSLLILLQASGFSLNALSLAEISRKRHYVETSHYLKSLPFLLFTAVAL